MPGVTTASSPGSSGPKDVRAQIEELRRLDASGLHQDDFLLTWDRSDDEIRAVLAVADALRGLRQRNISSRIFDSGLAISIFRDNSTRTRFSFQSACNYLGLTVADFDEGTSQVAHGETVMETANMISFMADVIGIRDDMYIGKGQAFMRDVASHVQMGHERGVLEQRPTLVNLQCDVDHPSQSLADLLHLVHAFGGLDGLRGRKLAMTWAYSPSYGKPLSVPQGMIALMSRFGMDIVLAHPEGYEVMAEPMQLAARFSAETGGSFRVTNDMGDAFDGADVVCPKSWAPFAAMQERTDLHTRGDSEGIAALEQRLLAQNAEHRDWTTTEALTATTRGGEGLYLHPLPADITGVSCERGEVDASVFDRHRLSLYAQASNKPYAIAAMIFLQKIGEPVSELDELLDGAAPRRNT